MKLKRFGKNSLALRHLKKQTKQVVELGKAPIIAAIINLNDGVRIETSGAVIKLLCEAIGEDEATSWHAKYMEKFDKLSTKAYKELGALIEDAKKKKGITSNEQTED